MFLSHVRLDQLVRVENRDTVNQVFMLVCSKCKPRVIHGMGIFASYQLIFSSRQYPVQIAVQ